MQEHSSATVRCQAFKGNRRTPRREERVLAERSASAAGEERIRRLPSAFGQPDPQDAARLGGERCVPLLAALAVAAEVGSGAELTGNVISPYAK